MNRTEALCQVLGWQGGTIHQVALETGCPVDAILWGSPASTELSSDYTGGWFASRTCSTEHLKSKLLPKYQGNVDFWLGAAEGKIMQLQGK